MKWIKLFIKNKGIKNKFTAKDIQDFINRKIEENLHLEYKDIEKIKDINGIKHVLSRDLRISPHLESFNELYSSVFGVKNPA